MNKIQSLLSHLKTKWQIQNNWDFLMINVVFAVAGILIGFERKPIFSSLGITQQTPLWVKILIYVPLIVPLYQMNLLIFGFLLGQFPFFWEKEKRLVQFLFRHPSKKYKA
ncbi:MAG: hypothetical protein Q7S13_05930 [Candidatus Omnitrophota bacterium]|jgi:hypothetical protein|nr:hypothetical protein [Candidatus Omnitrophota bacterium]